MQIEGRVAESHSICVYMTEFVSFSYMCSHHKGARVEGGRAQEARGLLSHPGTHLS